MLLDLIKTEGFDHIYEVEPFEKEFKKTVKENKRYYKWLREKLSILEALGTEALKLRDFEPLPSTNPKLYSIRNPNTPINPRVIYIYASGKNIYLLTAFKEGSKNSNSDYGAAIKVAEERLKYIKNHVADISTTE